MKLYKIIRVWILFLSLLVTSQIFSQKTVTGKVFNNNDHQPVPDASVQVKGTEIGTKTTNDGSFSVNVPRNNSVLVISNVGFQTTEIPVSGRTNIGDVSLTGSSINLNEVVVTGYSAQRKKDITGAVAVVNVANLKSVPSGTTESLLQGQAAGVTVINSGAPGGASNVRVRGITSVGSTDPW